MIKDRISAVSAFQQLFVQFCSGGVEDYFILFFFLRK